MKKAPFLPVLIGTGFGSGFSPFAPGTAGALLASIIWIALYLLLPFSVVLWITAALVIVFTFAGIWAADKLEACWGEDPSRVVVDEMVGVWIPLLAVPDNDKWICSGGFRPVPYIRHCQAIGHPQNGESQRWGRCDDG